MLQNHTAVPQCSEKGRNLRLVPESGLPELGMPFLTLGMAENGRTTHWLGSAPTARR